VSTGQRSRSRVQRVGVYLSVGPGFVQKTEGIEMIEFCVFSMLHFEIKM